MNTNCRCGGKFRRTDIVPVVVNGKTLYQDTDPLFSNWKCDGCKEVRRKGKRQPNASKEIKVPADLMKSIMGFLDQNSRLERPARGGEVHMGAGMLCTIIDGSTNLLKELKPLVHKS